MVIAVEDIVLGQTSAVFVVGLEYPAEQAALTLIEIPSFGNDPKKRC